jgi:hypothetical protein
MLRKINNNMIKKGGVICLYLSLSACQSSNAIGNTEPKKYPEYVITTDILPINSITTIDGTELNLHRNDKKKLVILFASWCTDSNRLLVALNSSPLLEDKSIEIVAIAREEDRATITAWRDKRGIKVALAVDSDRNIYKRFASGGIPRLITVGKNNKIIKMNLAEGDQQLEKIVWQ